MNNEGLFNKEKLDQISSGSEAGRLERSGRGNCKGPEEFDQRLSKDSGCGYRGEKLCLTVLGGGVKILEEELFRAPWVLVWGVEHGSDHLEAVTYLCTLGRYVAEEVTLVSFQTSARGLMGQGWSRCRSCPAG